MPDGRQPKNPRPAIARARRVWKDTTAAVYRATIHRHGTASSWLKAAGGRRHKIIKGADHLARLVEEMEDAGFTPDRMDAALLTLVRGVREEVAGTRPAA